VQRHQSAFSSPPVYPFCSFSPFSSSVSLSFPVDIPLFFVFLSFDCFSLYPVGFSLSVSPIFLPSSLFSLLFFPPLVFCTRTVFIGAGGAGTTLPRPIAVHRVRSRRSTLSQHRLRRLMGMSLVRHGLSVFSS